MRRGGQGEEAEAQPEEEGEEAALVAVSSAAAAAGNHGSRRGLGLLCPRRGPGSLQALCSCRGGPYAPDIFNSSGSSSQLQPSALILPHVNQGEEATEAEQSWGRLRHRTAGRGGTDPSFVTTRAVFTGVSTAAGRLSVA